MAEILYRKDTSSEQAYRVEKVGDVRRDTPERNSS